MFCANLRDVCAEVEHKRKFDCQIFTRLVKMRCSYVKTILLQSYGRYKEYVQEKDMVTVSNQQPVSTNQKRLTVEKLDSLLTILGDASDEREPLISDIVVAGVKAEEGYMRIRLKIKGKDDSYTFHMAYETLKDLRDFLERIAFADQEPIAWESEHPGVLHR